ncbi:hypothetical protein V8C86DRAFT_3136655 [Haematococcus lacustris]
MVEPLQLFVLEVSDGRQEAVLQASLLQLHGIHARCTYTSSCQSLFASLDSCMRSGQQVDALLIPSALLQPDCITSSLMKQRAPAACLVALLPPSSSAWALEPGARAAASSLALAAGADQVLATPFTAPDLQLLLLKLQARRLLRHRPAPAAPAHPHMPLTPAPAAPPAALQQASATPAPHQGQAARQWVAPPTAVPLTPLPALPAHSSGLGAAAAAAAGASSFTPCLLTSSPGPCAAAALQRLAGACPAAPAGPPGLPPGPATPPPLSLGPPPGAPPPPPRAPACPAVDQAEQA